MDSDKLIATGLTNTQAEAYAMLIERGEISPPAAAEALRLTRSNAYKVFDKLAELGLAVKLTDGKSMYRLGNPLALTNLAATLRAEATAREEAINSILKTVTAKYYEHTEQPGVDVVSGKQQVANAFRNQIGLGEDIHFIRTPADIPLMGFDGMHEIRSAPARRGAQRHGILPDGFQGPVNYKNHERSNLALTWVRHEDYSAPVEWSATASSLLIVLYGTEPHAITITDPIIAGAFLQLWHLLDGCLRAMPYYASLPRQESAKK